MKQDGVLWLEDVRRGDVPRVGGKAANLGELIGAGFSVPPGFVITASAYRSFVEAGRIMPPALEAEILAAYRTLQQRCGEGLVCAVRSSATAEDTDAASFAGQHGTYYYVEEPQLITMVQNCWASLWSREAVSYRDTHGMDHASVYMAVIVQRMVPAEVSGVTFTLNPVTGARDEIVVESSWGMGAGIVDGRVTPDRYVLNRSGLGITEQRIAQKRVRVSTTLRQDAVQRVVEVPFEQRQAATLPPERVVEIARLALGAEERFGSPQDMEWAVAEGRVHVLQSRPVTVSGAKPFCRNERGKKYVLFKPLIENFTDPLTPLTANTFMQGAVAAGYALIGGRVYADVDVVRRLVPFKLTDEEVAQLFYLSLEGVRPKFSVSYARLPFALSAGALASLMFANFMVRTAHLPADFMGVFRRAAEKIDRDDTIGPVDAFRRLLLGGSATGALLSPAGRHVMAANASAMRYFVWLFLLSAVLRRWVPDLPREALGLLASGSEDVLSAEAGRRILGLAREARGNDTVQRLLTETPQDSVLPLLRRTPEATGFVRQVDAFLATFGHRALKEFEFRSPRWEEDPSPVMGMVRNYLLSDADPAEHEARAATRRAEVERLITELLGRLPFERTLGLRGRLVRYLAGRVKYFARLRENSRFYWVMGAYVMRRKILRLESRLIAEGRLKCRDDIFFLTWPEVRQLEDGTSGWRDVEARIAERRREHVRLSKVTPPRTIGLVTTRPPVEAAAGGAASLRGQTASPGRAEGMARVILDPAHDAELRPGEILVAPFTDPAWTPLFLTAAAAVVEVGSFLSHAGTVAREYGLPCVVDVADCTRRIRTGDRLLVDGDAGLVTVLSRGA